MAHKDPIVNNFIDFLNASPTAWHAVDVISHQLTSQGFSYLNEADRWDLKPGGAYVIKKNGSLCAFVVPKGKPQKAKIIGSHTDSPGFKLKPNCEFVKETLIMLGLEIYGSPLITSWLNRDLGIAGRIIHKDSNGAIHESLVKLDQDPIVIPQLAIHLDRHVNEDGMRIDRQEHLAALAAIVNSEIKLPYLASSLKKVVPFEQLLGSDLFVYPLEGARLAGMQGQLISSYRIDSLSSVHAAWQAFSHQPEPLEDCLKMITFWNHEEIGSHTSQGAGSPFLSNIFERIALSYGLDRQDLMRLIHQSFCISADLTHAFHPNYSGRHEPHHLVFLDDGIAIKTSAAQKYASDAYSSAVIADLCIKNKIPYKYFIAHGNIPSGSTIGPIHAGLTGMRTVDIGSPQLSMHSCRELMSTKDHCNMYLLLKAFLD